AFFFSSRRRHTRFSRDWSSDVCSSDLQFVIPLGATINMNGTALYQAVATVFLAQVYGIDLSVGSMALVVAMAVGASIGSPATPRSEERRVGKGHRSRGIQSRV